MSSRGSFFSRAKSTSMDIDDDEMPVKNVRRSTRIMKPLEERSTINLDDYTPVFIYSHAEYASNTICKVHNPSSSPDATYDDNFKTLSDINDFFVSVPENTVVIDPISPGYLCSSHRAVDYKFPDLLAKKGIDMWFSNDSSSKYKKKIFRKKALRDFYNNTKLYFEGDKINNFELVFDKDGYMDIPWNIRVPGPDGKLVTVLNEWTRQYTSYKVSDGYSNCIYLDELIQKLDKDLRPKFENKKMALIFVSCRPYPDLKIIEDEINKTDYLLRVKQIIETGIENTKLYRNVSTMVLRPTSKSAYEYDEPDEETDVEMDVPEDVEMDDPEDVEIDDSEDDGTDDSEDEEKTFYDYLIEFEKETADAYKFLGTGEKRQYLLRSYKQWSRGEIMNDELNLRLRANLMGGRKKRRKRRKKNNHTKKTTNKKSRKQQKHSKNKNTRKQKNIQKRTKKYSNKK